MDSNKCIYIDDISVVDGSDSHAGVRRCRDTEVTSSGSAGKRRKFYVRDQDQNVVVQSESDCLSRVNVNSSVSKTESGTSDHVLLSPCFQKCLLLDLKAELRFETEPFMSVNDGFSGVTSPSSEICIDSDKMESFSTMKRKPAPRRAVTCHRKPAATSEKLPMTAEIEEFFSAVEKKEQKRLSDKYNFDFVNDVPLEGRYHWVQLKP